MQFNLNVTPATLLNFGGTAQKEIEISYMCWDMFPVFLASYFISWSRKVSTNFHPHDVAVCFEILVLVLFSINVELKLLNCCLLPLSEQKLFQLRHDACFFVTTKLCITPFISRWKHMLLLRPLSPGTVYAFC